MLEVPPAWNAVPDLMMEAEDGWMITKVATKGKQDKVAFGRRKLWRVDDIQPEKRERSSKVFGRTQNRAGFYSEDWDELQQEEDDWQMPDKW